MATFTIPARTIQAGVSVLGPASPGAGLNSVTISLDVTNLTPSMDVLLEHSPDSGTTWRSICHATLTGPFVDGQGVTQNTASLQGSLGHTAAGAILTTATSLVRATLTNTTAFNTAGGTLSAS